MAKEKMPGWNYQDDTDMGADAAFMSPESLGVVRQGKDLYQKGFEAGDQEMMDQGHAMAEGERAKYGYSGGANGGGYIGLAPTVEEPDYGKAPGEYKTAMDRAIQALQSRKPFTYDPETDPNYQQYKEQYTRLGKRAMEDSYGHAALRTGGLGGSAAMSASQQAYNGYMEALADKVPQLRQIAYQMWQDEEDRLRRDIDLYGGLDAQAWDRWNSDRSFQRGAYESDRSFEHGKAVDQWNMARNLDRDQKADAETAYQHAWDAEARDYTRAADKAAALASSGDFSGYAQLWGLSEEATQRLVDKYAEEQRLTKEQAARDLADWYAGYGDLSKARALGVNPQLAVSGSGRKIVGGPNDDDDQEGPGGLSSSMTELVERSMGDGLGGMMQFGLGRLGKEQDTQTEQAESVTNRADDDGVYVPTVGWVNWADLEELVNSGQVLESVNSKTGTHTYTLNPKYGRRGE